MPERREETRKRRHQRPFEKTTSLTRKLKNQSQWAADQLERHEDSLALIHKAVKVEIQIQMDIESSASNGFRQVRKNQFNK